MALRDHFFTRVKGNATQWRTYCNGCVAEYKEKAPMVKRDGTVAWTSDNDEEEPPVLTSAGLARLTPWRKMTLQDSLREESLRHVLAAKKTEAQVENERLNSLADAQEDGILDDGAIEVESDEECRV
ncbi:hypothetical protein DL96DRAFT_1552249 [Flagelloscypha sp. PMI_526]|nr:hypothetical protein DL96DRAFT_1552249 [Flagelloscypha sp. PMI_526]